MFASLYESCAAVLPHLTFCERMIAFEISRNGQVLAVVGACDLISLNAVLMAYGDLSGSGGVPGYFSMNANGYGSGPIKSTVMHHTWDILPIDERFEVGDTISIRMVRTEAPTPPTTTQQIEVDETDDEDAEQAGASDGEKRPY